MAYPDLPPSPTFWRCPNCGKQSEFRVSGTSHIECTNCGKIWSAEQLVEAHKAAHPETASTA